MLMNTLKELSDIVAAAANSGEWDAEASVVIEWRGVDLRITITPDCQEEK